MKDEIEISEVRAKIAVIVATSKIEDVVDNLLEAIIALKKKWETEAYKKGYIDGGINQLTNGDK